MHLRLAPIAFSLAVVASFAVPAHAAKRLRLTVSGSLASVVEGMAASGAFRMTTSIRANGTPAPRVRLDATGLDGTRGLDGLRPRYLVFLLNGVGGETQIGALRTSASGRGRLRVRSRVSLPPVLRGLEGGLVEVRREGVPILRGGIGGFTVAGAGTSISIRTVTGRFEAVDRPRQSPGSYVLRSAVDGEGVRRQRVGIVSSRLDTAPASNGVRPTYTAFLVSSTGATANLGTMHREKQFGVSLFLNTDAGTLQSKVADVTAFGGGRIEIRRGSTVIVRGPIYPFRGVDEGGVPFRTVRARGVEALLPPSGAVGAFGIVDARVSVRPEARKQRLRVRVQGLAVEAGPYSVLVLSGQGSVTLLGTFETRTLAGIGGIRVVSSRTRVARNSGVLGLGGKAVEVRDGSGVVVLTGTFPEL